MVAVDGLRDHDQDDRCGPQREGGVLSRRTTDRDCPRVAITTDWLTSFGGAERVLHHLRVVYPDAPIFTSVYDPAGLPPDYRGWDVRPTRLQRLPVPTRYSRALLPLMPRAFSRLDLAAYDVVITVSSAFSKNVQTVGGTKNLCYCLTPPRYLWDLQQDYLRAPLARTLTAPVTNWLRSVDLAAARRVDEFVAISDVVADRVRRTYGRHASVVYPPVDTHRLKPSGEPPEDHLLVVSRLVPYKRVDLAIAACNRLRRRLLIVGDGPERRRLERMAGPTVTFLGRRPDHEVAALLANCRAFVFPGFEDFGIAPVEAQAAGRPVIAYGQGGAAETVCDGVTGVHFSEQSADALVAAIQRFDALDVDPAACRANAERFDAETFRTRIDALVRESCAGARSA